MPRPVPAGLAKRTTPSKNDRPIANESQTSCIPPCTRLAARGLPQQPIIKSSCLPSFRSPRCVPRRKPRPRWRRCPTTSSTPTKRGRWPPATRSASCTCRAPRSTCRRRRSARRRGLRTGRRELSRRLQGRRAARRRRRAELLRLPPAHGRARADGRGGVLLDRRVRSRPDQEAREDAARQGRRPHAPHAGDWRADRPGVPDLSRLAGGRRRRARASTPATPLFDFIAPDGVRHECGGCRRPRTRRSSTAFAAVPALYIADGHHRAASAGAHASGAARRDGAGRARSRPGRGVPRQPDAGPALQPRGAGPARPDARARSWRRSRRRCAVTRGRSGRRPPRKGEVAMYLDGAWYTLDLGAAPAGLRRCRARRRAAAGRRARRRCSASTTCAPTSASTSSAASAAPRSSSGWSTPAPFAVAFSLFPVSVDDLMRISDAGGIMPPKSTWFEPKLRDGLLSAI